MTCIHGLDEINCPTCRILRSTLPTNKLQAKKEQFLKIKNPFFKKNLKVHFKDFPQKVIFKVPENAKPGRRTLEALQRTGR